MTRRWIDDADALKLVTSTADRHRERVALGARPQSWVATCELVRSTLISTIEGEAAPEAKFADLVEAAAMLVQAADDVQREELTRRRYDEQDWD